MPLIGCVSAAEALKGVFEPLEWQVNDPQIAASLRRDHVVDSQEQRRHLCRGFDGAPFDVG